MQKYMQKYMQKFIEINVVDYLTGLLQLYLGSCVRLCSSAN